MAEQTSNNPETILVVDDDPGMLLLITTILDNEGQTFVTASDGVIAQRMIEEDPHRFAAILLDWDMPRMTGIELLRWIKEQHMLQNIPVIMQTALNTAQYIKEGIDAGAFYYLTKPFDRKVLLSIVNAALADFQYKRSLVRKLRESENPFMLLIQGTFRFRTLSEGERLVLWIANACPSPDRAMQMSEIFINAVEHGNLGITYEEKTEFVEEGTWSGEIERRLALPEHAHKSVEVQVNKYPEKLTVLVEDQGQGFDYERFLNFEESRVFDNHGRGIAMARAALDLQYIGSGNKVLVTIPYQ